MTLALEHVYAPWPDPASVAIGTRGYKTPAGNLQRVTKFLKVLGLGTDALVKWSANTERAAVLEAAGETFAAGGHDGPPEFIAAVEARIGPARQHQRLITKAGDIGTAAHELVAWTMKDMLGQAQGPRPVVGEASEWAFMAWEDWWKKSGLAPVRVEQPVWDVAEGYAGTIDLVAEHPTDGLGIIDLKTSKYIYDEHHLQVAAYMHAGRNYADLRWAKIVRVPKSTDDPAFEVRPLGQMYDRTLTEAQLMDCFRAAKTAYNLLVAK